MADMVIPFGRYGLFVWPMWSWLIRFVADMVCGRYGTDPEDYMQRMPAIADIHCESFKVRTPPCGSDRVRSTG